jgi:hypothetical protein
MFKSPIQKVLLLGALTMILVVAFILRERSLDAQVAQILARSEAERLKDNAQAEQRNKENQNPARLKAAQNLFVQLKEIGRESNAPWRTQLVRVRAYDGEVVIDTKMPTQASQAASFRSLCEVTTSLAFKPEYAALKAEYVKVLTKDVLPGASSTGATGACQVNDW